MFLQGDLRNDILIGKRRRVINHLHSARKISSCACLVGSGLKFIFYWNAHSPVFFKSLFRSIFEASTFLTTGTSEVSLTNNLVFDAKLSHKSMI